MPPARKKPAKVVTRRHAPLPKAVKTAPELVVELYPDRRPWEYHPWETQDAYYAFCTYLKLGPTRTLSKVSFELLDDEKKKQILSGEVDHPSQLEKKKVGRKPKQLTAKGEVRTSKSGFSGHIAQWSTDFMWVERATLWEAYLAEQDRKMLLDARADYTSRSIQYGKDLAAMGWNYLKKLDDKGVVPRHSDALKMIELGNKIEKGGIGLDDETALKINLSVQNNFDFEGLSDAELDQLIELNGKVVSRVGADVLTARVPPTGAQKANKAK